jgi:hypothetical protein
MFDEVQNPVSGQAPLKPPPKKSSLKKPKTDAASATGKGQSTSRYMPAGSQATERDIERGIIVFMNPNLFNITNDNLTRDAMSKIIRDIQKKYLLSRVSIHTDNLRGKIKGLLADPDYKDKVAERLAYLGANVEFKRTDEAQEYKKSFEKDLDRYFPVRRLEEKTDEPGDESEAGVDAAAASALGPQPSLV